MYKECNLLVKKNWNMNKKLLDCMPILLISKLKNS